MNNHHRIEVAKRKAGIAGWEPYEFECIGSDAVALTGGVPRLLKRGPRKGKQTWDGKGTTEVVTQSELKTEQDRYESQTGKCGKCMGSGKLYAGWNSVDGTKYRTCNPCGGSGTAAQRNEL